MTEPIRIVRAITRLNIGGPSQQAVILTSALNDARFQSRLICGLPGRHEGDLTRDAAASGRVTQIPALRNQGGAVDAVKAVWALYREFKTSRPAIVHLHQFKARLFGALAARAAGVPHIVQTYHGTVLAGYFARPVAAVVLALEQCLGRRLVHHTIAISPAVSRELVQRGIADARRITVIPLGLDLGPLLQPPAAAGAFRKEFGIPGDALVVGFVGRLVGIKAPHLFVQAAAALIRNARRPIFAVVVGDGPERPHLEAQAAQSGMGRRILFAGWRRNLREIYWDLDVLALTSLNEGTPVVIIEAMAARRAVVATSVGGVPDVVDDGVTGVLVSPRNVGQLTAALTRVLSDEALRARLGAAAQQAVYPRYDAATLVAAIRQYYLRVLAEDRGGPRESRPGAVSVRGT